MKKTKVLIGFFVFTFAAFLSIYGYVLTTPKSSSIVLFPNPTNEAQKLANAVIAVNKTRGLNVDLPNQGKAYTHSQHSHRLYIANEIYEVKVTAYGNVESSLYINYYLTNRPLDQMKTPADLIAQELMNGRSEIYIEEHISDHSVDMSVDAYKTFVKKTIGVREGFTSAERDSGTADVEEYLYHDGYERGDDIWRAASKKTVYETTEHYRKMVTKLLKVLEKK